MLGSQQASPQETIMNSSLGPSSTLPALVEMPAGTKRPVIATQDACSKKMRCESQVKRQVEMTWKCDLCGSIPSLCDSTTGCAHEEQSLHYMVVG